MIQDQLVEYVSSQLKLGISRDAIKSALTSVGWAPLDVEDTLKKVEGVATAPMQPGASQKTMDVIGGSMTSTTPKFVSFSAPATVAGQAKNPEPQTVRVSDLVSAVAPASSSAPIGNAPKIVSSNVVSSGKTAAAVQDTISKVAFTGTPSTFTAPSEQKKKGIGLLGILAVVLIVLLGALSGYLFFKNSGLNSQIQAQGGQNQGASQSSTAEIQAQNASNTALMAQVASLTSTTQDLSTNLSFLMVPVGTPSPVTTTPVSVSGILSAGLGKNTYIITTPYGIKTYVKNSSDSGVAATLQPLLGSTIQVSGTYLPGTPNITVTSVNGAPISVPPTVSVTPAAAKTNTTITNTTTTTMTATTTTVTP